jgi:CBS domain-containing protein
MVVLYLGELGTPGTNVVTQEISSHAMTLDSIMRPAAIIDDEASVREALLRMNQEKTNELLIVDQDGILIGEVSVSDLLGAAIPSDLDGDDALAHLADETAFGDAMKAAADKPLIEVMASGVESILADARLIDVAATAIAMGQVRIPVVDQDGHPIGIVSRQGLRHILSMFMEVEE